jgi:hypothetical protein
VSASWLRRVAPEGLIQRDGVGIAIGEGLRAADDRLLVSLLGAQQRRVIHRTQVAFSGGQIRLHLLPVGQPP